MTDRERAEDFRRDLPTCHPSVRQVYEQLIAHYERRAEIEETHGASRTATL